MAPPNSLQTSPPRLSKRSLNSFLSVKPGTRLCLELVVLFAAVLLSRIPFLDAGYGLHADAWRVAGVARHIAETGDYEYSRPPGFPIHELACASLWKWRAIGLNGLSAAASAVGALLFALYARRAGCRDYLLAALGLSFTPAFFINSVSAKDFTLTLAFILGSFVFAQRGRALGAGLCLGLAAGCRSVIAVLGLPLMLLVIATSPPEKRGRHFLSFFSSSALIAAACYIPIILKFGKNLMVLNAPLGYPPLPVVAERGTIEVWGVLGIAGLLLATAGIAWGLKTGRSKLPGRTEDVAAWIVTITLTLAFYVWLPDQPGYLIPALPFVILIASRFCPRPIFQIFCAMLIASPWVAVENGRPSTGLIFRDHQQRLSAISQINGFLAYCGSLKGNYLVVVGAWEPHILLLAPESARSHFVYLLPPDQLLKALRSKQAIYYCAAQIRDFEFKIYGVDLKKYGAIDLRAAYLKDLAARRLEGGN